MSTQYSLSLLSASERRPLQCEECAITEAAPKPTEHTSGIFFRLLTVHADDPLQLAEESFHHTACMPVTILHCATPTGCIERISGYEALSDDVKRALHSQLSPLLLRAVNVMYDVEVDGFKRDSASYVHQKHIKQLQCKQCESMLVDAVELPCCPAYALCNGCWSEWHLSRSVLIDKGGCETCSKPSKLVSVVSCPSCKRGVEVASVKEDVAMRTRVGGKLVRCRNEKHGCEEVIKASDALDHIAVCKYKQAHKQAAQEGKAEMDADEDEEVDDGEEEYEDEEEDGKAEGVTVSSDSDSNGDDDDDNDERVVEDAAPAEEKELMSRSVTFTSPLVTTSSATPPAQISLMADNVEAKLTDATATMERIDRMKATAIALDSTVDAEGAEVLLNQQLPASAVDKPDARRLPICAASTMLLASVDAPATPLVSTDASGVKMSLSLLQLRQHLGEQLTEPQPDADVEQPGSVKRAADAAEAEDGQDKKRVKSERQA